MLFFFIAWGYKERATYSIPLTALEAEKSAFAPLPASLSCLPLTFVSLLPSLSQDPLVPEASRVKGQEQQLWPCPAVNSGNFYWKVSTKVRCSFQSTCDFQEGRNLEPSITSRLFFSGSGRLQCCRFKTRKALKRRKVNSDVNSIFQSLCTLLHFLSLSQRRERICKCSETTEIHFSQNANSLQDRTFWKWMEQEEK